jgi:hypothetical protein
MRKSVAAVIAASAAVSGCGVHAEEGGGGATVSRNYQVGNFQQIEVAGPYDVEVRTGSGPTVSASGSEKLLDRTTVEVKGDKLVIHPENNHSWFNFSWSTHGKANFTVTVPQLSGATIAGSGDVHVDKVQGDSFEGNVAGSGGIMVGNMDVQNLKLAIAGSGGVKAAGKAKNAQYDIAGSGGIDGAGIVSEQAKVSIAGSGDVKAHATSTADVSIMGSGDVEISGGAKCNVSKAGSGNVRCS